MLYVFVVLLEGSDNYANAVCFGAGKIMSNEAPYVWVSLRRDEKMLVSCTCVFLMHLP